MKKEEVHKNLETIGASVEEFNEVVKQKQLEKLADKYLKSDSPQKVGVGEIFASVLLALIVFALLSNFPGCRINVDTEFSNGGVKYQHY